MEEVSLKNHDRDFQLSTRQQKVFSLLSLRSPELAQRYKAALMAFAGKDNPESIVQAAHSARYLIKHLHKIRKNAPEYRGREEAFGEVRKFVSRCFEKTTVNELAQASIALKSYYDTARVDQTERLVELISSEDKHDITYEDSHRIPVQVFGDCVKLFDGIAHYKLPDDLQAEFERAMNDLEELLRGLLEGHHALLKELRELMELKTPSEKQYRTLPALLMSASRFEHFFNNLNHVEWLAYLGGKGYFKKPVPAKSVAGGKMSPPWPQATYLQLCAVSAPSAVVNIILDSEQTDNWNVPVQLVDVALELPVADMKLIVGEKTREWIEYNSQTILPIRLAKLTGKLCDEQAKECFQLFEQLIAVRRYEPPPSPEPHALSSHKALSYYDADQYGEIITALVPKLVAFDGTSTIRILRRTLEKAVNMESRNRPQMIANGYRVWRPFIGESDRKKYGNPVIDSLITGLRDSILARESASDRNADSPLELKSGASPLFRRIELYALSRHSDRYMTRVCTVVTDPDYVYSDALEVEFDALISSAFARLPENIRNRFLELVDAGPRDIDAREGKDEQK